MKKVEPIRDLDILYKIYEYLKLRNERDYIMFMIGTNTGLRIGDILKLKVRDFKNKDCLIIREQKTSQTKEVPINPDLKKAMKYYIEDKDLNDYILPSQKNPMKPIQRNRAYTILKEVGEVFNVEHIGTHTMRKTFGYHFYHQNNKDVSLLMTIFNHSDQHVTLRYIGVTSDLCKTALKRFSFFKNNNT